MPMGGGAFGPDKRAYYSEFNPFSEGIDMILFEKIMSKTKAVNAYVWCNKAQIFDYIKWFLDHDCSWDLITWHKTNPTPLCSNKYLSDTEYVIYGRAKGVPLYGSYETKRKWYVSPLNTADKREWGHPTIKPLNIVQTLIENSTLPGQTVLDPFMGSGTTAVACKRSGRAYLGFEVSEDYFATCMARIGAEGAKGTLESWGMTDADRPRHVPRVPVALQECEDRGRDPGGLARRRCIGSAGRVLVPLSPQAPGVRVQGDGLPLLRRDRRGEDRRCSAQDRRADEGLKPQSINFNCKIREKITKTRHKIKGMIKWR